MELAAFQECILNRPPSPVLESSLRGAVAELLLGIDFTCSLGLLVLCWAARVCHLCFYRTNLDS